MNDGKIIGSDLCVEFLETGDVKKIQSRGILLNQLVGSRLESMISGIHLRIKKADGYRTFPLVGSASPGGFAVLENQAVFSGSVDKLSYTVYVSPVENMLFYDVFLKNSGAAVTVDLIYAMDLGLAAEGHVTNNEAYNSQYIDHSAFDGENGRIVCSRQNQEQGGKFPYYQQGSLGKTTAFSTDGYRFFGPDYKWSGEIEGLQKSSIGTGVYQYEFAYVALQSEEIRLCDSARATFYGLFLPDMPKRVSAPLASANEIRKIHEKIGFPAEYELRKFSRSIDFSLGLCGRPFTDDEIEREYPVRRHKEYSDGRLVSFFTKNYEHVVLAEKERITERSHG
ncbi:MAG: hypothetical protein FWD94_01160, partial [Treponema sp.]|nr:hypothetical protein [Treponema sp.]